jgi:hypothetical protein
MSASVSPTSVFSGWSGACSGTGPCQVTMDAAKAVTATFDLRVEALTVTRKGKGSITSTPAGIRCPGDCSQGYAYGTRVALKPHAQNGWHFVKWSGVCSGKTCRVMMTQERKVKALFARDA